MHRLSIFSLALFTSAAMTANAIIINDPFTTGGAPNYNGNASLVGQGPTNVGGMTGNWLSGVGTGVLASDTGLTYSDSNYAPASGGSAFSTSSGNRVGRLLTTPYTDTSSETIYLSFLMQTEDSSSSTYRAFELHNGGFGDGSDRKLQIGFHTGDFGSSTNYGIRLDNVSITQSEVLGPNDGGVNLFVVQIDFSAITNNDQVTVWQNPDLTNPGAGTAISGFNMTFDRISFASFSNADTNWDEIRLGNSFASVTTVVPEPSTLALIGFAGILAIIRNRRR
ncbi:PEP-CTERM sorting domain-containing protein [Rubellicoccus peritrichatus]|uniref:PEP-CTERM sorting domain-containing protein n=1 Tax=Rubellicoccus peritrichatus TaxID=3080537 RepID=A0AAQ3QUX2_9BACT|nr:PEP-CTERM sorting domain-containing protein [Puniceicoccus sp. CR14]WOO42871.1 PEP-CTERM sorting domain-containing protein [Puniceicoccus sp. CR14]